MTANQKTLREWMAAYPAIGSYQKLAAFWRISESTVHAYLKPVSSKSHRPIPDDRLSALAEKLGVNRGQAPT